MDMMPQLRLSMNAHQHDQMTVLGAIEDGGYSIELVVEHPLHTGYNPVMIHVTNADGEPVDAPEFTLAPTMSMYDGKNHAAAVEQPVTEMAGMAHGAIAFPMPSGPDLGTWALEVTFTDPATDAAVNTTLDIEVVPSTLSGSFVTPDERKIFLTVVEPITPGVGAQPIEIFAYEKVSMTEWPAVDNLTLAIEPEMPTMGHGSPNNEDPTSVGNGHYAGVVNFSMAGSWTVTVTVSQGADELGEVVFEYNVEES